MTRVIIFTTHPIQYQAPWFAALAAEPDLEILVVFSYVPNAVEQGVGFGQAVKWDIALRDGYPSRVLASRMLPQTVPSFARRLVKGRGHVIDEFRPDAALVLGWQDLSMIGAMLACKRRGIPVIVRGESNALRQRSALISFLHGFYFQLFDVCIAIGKANAQLYLEGGVQPERIVTSGYFVDNDRFYYEAEALRADRSQIRTAWGIEKDAVCFAFVGKLELKKRPLDFVESLRLALDGGGKLCGLVVGNGELIDSARARAVGLSLPIAFAGFLNQSEIACAYVAADVLVLPSDFGETWGLVINEAMATGLPAIVSNRVGSAHDLVVDGETGLVVPFGDQTALAAAMSALAADSELRVEMGRKARAHVLANYTITDAVKATRQALKIALGAKHS